MSWAEQVYRVSPPWLQNVGVTLFGLSWRLRRFGPGFRRALREAKERETFDSSQWRDYQTNQLRRLLLSASENVPYYRERYRKLGVMERDLRNFSLEDLPSLPLVSKQDIRPNAEAFVSRNARRMHRYLTSGSTGTPLTVYMSPRTRRRWEGLYEARCRNWAGVNRTMRRAMIGGRLVVPKGEAAPPFWRVNWAEGQLYLSAFHISARTAPAYLEALKAYAPDYLVGYASAWFFLARFAQEQGLSAGPFKAILTSSEKLEPEMRKTLEQVFSTPVFDAYSGVEACCLASECEYHRLHLSPDAGIVEIVDENGEAVPAGVPGEIVATGLVNHDQPLIRYRTGDLAVLSTETCPCGRAMPVLASLVGRIEDVVIGPDGRETVRFHGLFVGVSGVVEGQVVQRSLNEIVIRLVPAETFAEKQEREIVSRVKARLGDVDVRIERVASIERTVGGKFPAVVSLVKRQGTGAYSSD